MFTDPLRSYNSSNPLSHQAVNKAAAGDLIFQQEWYEKWQMKYIYNDYTQSSPKNAKQIGKMIFGDNDIDAKRHSGPRKYYGGQAFVMGEYDRSFALGIITTFFDKYPYNPYDIEKYCSVVNKQFIELTEYLTAGYNIVIPVPKKEDIKKNRKIYYRNGQQVIFHNIGTGIANMSIDHLLYIQQKIDELRKYARRTSSFKYHMIKGDEMKSRIISEMKFDADVEGKDEKEMESATEIKWKWKENDGVWNLYDKNISGEIEKLQIDESYKYTFSGNRQTYKITKISDTSAEQINVKTSVKREVKRQTTLNLKNQPWQWKDEHGKWNDYDIQTNQQIEKLPIDSFYKYKFSGNKQTYKITRKSVYGAEQINVKTNVKRDVRKTPCSQHITIDSSHSHDPIPKYDGHRVIVDTLHGYMVNAAPVEGFEDQKTAVESSMQAELIKLQNELKTAKSKMEKIKKAAEEKEQMIKKENEELKKQMEQKRFEKSVVIWQWQENDKTWKSYDNSISDIIEKLIIGQNHQYTFSGNNQTYKITKKSSNSAEQVNTGTNVKRNVKRTTKARGLNQVQYPEWWNMSGIDLSQETTAADPKYVKPELITLNLNTTPGEDVVAHFRKTCNRKVVKVESIQNQRLYDSYWNERRLLIKSIGEDKLNEKDVYHGTKSVGTMKEIYTQGFMKVFNKAAAHGEGTYYARDAKYSDGYAAVDKNNTRQMFQCKVMMGESHQGKKSYKLTTWPKKENGLKYDSLVNTMNSPSIFVIHENVRAYPMFIIHYK